VSEKAVGHRPAPKKILRLKARLRYQERTAKAGLSGPSAKDLFGAFHRALAALAQNEKRDPYNLLFDSS
jgi:hypothetical protein